MNHSSSSSVNGSGFVGFQCFCPLRTRVAAGYELDVLRDLSLCHHLPPSNKLQILVMISAFPAVLSSSAISKRAVDLYTESEPDYAMTTSD